MSCKTRGLRVTIPVPLGRKSRPTMFSKTEDLPLKGEERGGGEKVRRMGCKSTRDH